MIGSGWNNVVSHAPGTNYVIRVLYEWSKFDEDWNEDMKRIKTLLPDNSRFVFDAYSLLSKKQFRERYPIAYADLIESGYPFYPSENPIVHFTVLPLLEPILSLNLEQANFLRESLRIMHASGVVHRDLHGSPRNYMMQNGLPVFIDFDFASLELGHEFRYSDTFTERWAGYEKSKEDWKVYIAEEKIKDIRDNEQNIFLLSQKYLLVQESGSKLVIIVEQSGTETKVRDEKGNDTVVKFEMLKKHGYGEI